MTEIYETTTKLCRALKFMQITDDDWKGRDENQFESVETESLKIEWASA